MRMTNSNVKTLDSVRLKNFDITNDANSSDLASESMALPMNERSNGVRVRTDFEVQPYAPWVLGSCIYVEGEASSR